MDLQSYVDGLIHDVHRQIDTYRYNYYFIREYYPSWRDHILNILQKHFSNVTLCNANHVTSYGLAFDDLSNDQLQEVFQSLMNNPDNQYGVLFAGRYKVK